MGLEKEKIAKYSFAIILLVLLYFVYRLVMPFVTYVFLALVLLIAAKPLYSFMLKHTRKERLSSVITILLLLMIIIIPMFMIANSLIVEAANFISSIDATSFQRLNDYAVSILGKDVDISTHLSTIVVNVQNFIVNSALSFVGSVTDIILGLFVMFFIMYYGFLEGDYWFKYMSQVLPFSKSERKELVVRIKNVTSGVVYGQVLVALVQGILGGIGFFVLGLSNPVLWGFIMTLTAFLPFGGTGFIWLPAAIIEILKGNVLIGVLLIIYGALIVSTIDNLIRPKLISEQAKLHPVVVLIGVLGGLKLFGFIGIIIGPLIGALAITLAQFFYKDYIKSKDEDEA